jgi:hypothetical protein
MDRSCSDARFGARPDCAAIWEIVAWFMTDENRHQSETQPALSQPAGEAGNISERVRVLREKASDLSQTLDRVEETLREAQCDSKE